MSRSPGQIQAELLALVPDGFAWRHDADSYQGALLLPWATELALAEASIEAMLPEVDPGQAMQLLPDYERVLGPDPCGRDQLALTDADRRAVARQRWTAGAEFCAGYVEALAAGFGIAATVTEFTVFQAGLTECGSELVQDPNQHTFLVGLPATRVTIFETGDSVAGDLLGDFTPNLVECVIRSEAPLHTVPYFSYSG